MANKRSIVWVDGSAQTRQTILNGLAPAGPLSLVNVQTQLLLLSNASLQDSFEGTASGPAGAPTIAVYQNVSDYAVLSYVAADNTVAYVTLPAPQSGIFLADGETVDGTLIGALTAAVVGEIITASGMPVTSFVNGFRRSRLKEYQ